MRISIYTSSKEVRTIMAILCTHKDALKDTKLKDKYTGIIDSFGMKLHKALYTKDKKYKAHVQEYIAKKRQKAVQEIKNSINNNSEKNDGTNG